MIRFLLWMFLFFSIPVFAQETSLPIIDIHLHSYDAIPSGMPASWAGEDYARILLSPEDADTHHKNVLDELNNNNIRLAVVSSTSLSSLIAWKNGSPDLFLTGIQTIEGTPILSLDSLSYYAQSGQIDMLGELGLQYYGMKPDDPSMLPYYSIAEDEDIPVCLHTGLGPPGGPHSFAPDFRATLGRPTLFEPVLAKHPELRAFLAHAGWPYINETIAMMYVYPELYVDLGVLSWALPKKAYYSALEQLMNAGFGKRIMFGTDQMMWPEAISIAVKTVNETPFLSEEEKRDILYNNAARFLKLSEETIAIHHTDDH